MIVTFKTLNDIQDKAYLRSEATLHVHIKPLLQLKCQTVFILCWPDEEGLPVVHYKSKKKFYSSLVSYNS